MPQTGKLTADGTEQILFTTSDFPGFTFWYLSLDNMQDGDKTTVKEKVDIQNTGTFDLFQSQTFSGSQVESVISQSTNLLSLSKAPVRVTVEQTAGTNREYLFAEAVKF